MDVEGCASRPHWGECRLHSGQENLAQDLAMLEPNKTWNLAVAGDCTTTAGFHACRG
jgi:hypothetical protein